MDQFYEVEEVALYRRRYVLKNPPVAIEGLEPSLLSDLVGSSISKEYPENYTLVTPIKEITYKVKKLDLNNLEGATKTCVSCLTNLDEPEPVVKKTKVKFVNDGSLNIDKVPKSVEPKPRRLKSVDWEALAKKGNENETLES